MPQKDPPAKRRCGSFFTLGGIAALIAALVSLGVAVVGLQEYHLKSESQRVETDVRLSQLFAELVPIANGRGESLISEQVVTKVLRRLDPDATPEKIATALESAAITLPIGEATQAAAIASIGYLGANHKVLHTAAREALTTLNFKDQSIRLENARHLALLLIRREGSR